MLLLVTSGGYQGLELRFVSRSRLAQFDGDGPVISENV